MSHVPVLMYHSVSRQAKPRFLRFTLTPEAFAVQMEYLATNGYTALTAARYADILRGAGDLPSRPVVITFDDGFADFHRDALPILNRHALPATLYVVTSFLEGTSLWLRPEGEQDRAMLTWSQIKEIAAAGIELGAHSHTHADLDAIDPAAARDEIERSRDALAERLGAGARTFAYPFGHYDRRVRALVQQAGFRGACAVRQAMSHPGDDPFAIARVIVPRDLPIERFAALLQGNGVRPARPAERPIVTAWRLIRRIRGRLPARPAGTPRN